MVKLVQNPSLSARSQCRTDDESHPFCFLCLWINASIIEKHDRARRTTSTKQTYAWPITHYTKVTQYYAYYHK